MSNDEGTLSGEERTENITLNRQPEVGDWAYVEYEGQKWMEGPNLPMGPVSKEIVMAHWKRDENRKEDEDGPYVDLSAIAKYMDRVVALHTADGEIYDIVYELELDLEPGASIDEETQ